MRVNPQFFTLFKWLYFGGVCLAMLFVAAGALFTPLYFLMTVPFILLIGLPIALSVAGMLALLINGQRNQLLLFAFLALIVPFVLYSTILTEQRVKANNKEDDRQLYAQILDGFDLGQMTAAQAQESCSKLSRSKQKGGGINSETCRNQLNQLIKDARDCRAFPDLRWRKSCALKFVSVMQPGAAQNACADSGLRDLSVEAYEECMTYPTPHPDASVGGAVPFAEFLQLAGRADLLSSTDWQEQRDE